MQLEKRVEGKKDGGFEKNPCKGFILHGPVAIHTAGSFVFNRLYFCWESIKQ